MATIGNITGDHLKQFIERIERLEEEKSTMAQDIREVYAEAKTHGFDAKTMRKIVGLRKLNPDERNEQEELLDLYMHAIGMAPAAIPASEVEEAA